MPGVASLLAVGVTSLGVLILRMILTPFILVAFKMTVAHLYPTSLGRLHLALFRAQKWWTGMQLHSRTVRVPVEGRAVSVFTIACFVDNYAYLVVDESGDGACPAALVDPADAPTVLGQLANIRQQHYAHRGMRVEAILTTHKHWDHQGGNKALCAHLDDLRVYGGAVDGVDCCTHPVFDGDHISVGTLDFEVVESPG